MSSNSLTIPINCKKYFYSNKYIFIVINTINESIVRLVQKYYLKLYVYLSSLILNIILKKSIVIQQKFPIVWSNKTKN